MRARWKVNLWERIVPACLFSPPMIAKLLLTQDAWGRFWHQVSWVHGEGLAVQALSLAYFGLLVGLYATRRAKVAGDKRRWMAVVAFYASFAVMGLSLLPGGPVHEALLLPGAILLLVGLAYSVGTLLFLNRSFSILPEARKLMTGGPYQWSRHPLYLGEMVMMVGFVLPGLNWLSGLVLVTSLIGQLVRIHAEEKVLRATFGQAYIDYAWQVPQLLPFWRRG